jgi:hypothetical protein
VAYFTDAEVDMADKMLAAFPPRATLPGGPWEAVARFAAMCAFNNFNFAAAAAARQARQMFKPDDPIAEFLGLLASEVCEQARTETNRLRTRWLMEAKQDDEDDTDRPDHYRRHLPSLAEPLKSTKHTVQSVTTYRHDARGQVIGITVDYDLAEFDLVRQTDPWPSPEQ